MLKKILVISFFNLFLLAGCFVFASEFSELLPVYPSRIKIVGYDGAVYSDRKKPAYELKTIKLTLERDSRSSTGYVVPKSVPEANEMLRGALTEVLYARLMNGYKEISVAGNSSADLALDERFGDLAIFFNKAWALKNNEYLIKNYKNRKDYIERFEGLLDSLSEYNERKNRN